MWTKYFKFVKLVPGKVVVPSHGTIDFSNPKLSIDLIKRLYEEDFPYLKITPEGEQHLYGRNINPLPVPPEDIPDEKETTDNEDINPWAGDDDMGAPLNPEQTHYPKPKRKTKNPRRKP